MERYKIIRHYSNGEKQIINSGVSLEDAKNHCNDPVNRQEEDGVLIWFDAYSLED